MFGLRPRRRQFRRPLPTFQSMRLVFRVFLGSNQRPERKHWVSRVAEKQGQSEGRRDGEPARVCVPTVDDHIARSGALLCWSGWDLVLGVASTLCVRCEPWRGVPVMPVEGLGASCTFGGVKGFGGSGRGCERESGCVGFSQPGRLVLDVPGVPVGVGFTSGCVLGFAGGTQFGCVGLALIPSTFQGREG